VVRFKKGILLLERKYVLDLFLKTGMLGCRSSDSPIDVNTKLLPDQRELIEDVGWYMRFVGKLTYLTVIIRTSHL